MKKENFESSLKRLEGIVRKLEEGDLPLEDSLRVFEEGMRLVQSCETRLNEARKKIEILMKGQDGKRRARDFGAEE